MITIKNCGSYHIENKITDATNNRIVKDFLKELSIDFVKKSSRYITFVGESPFYYRERQIHSILTPVLYDLTDACLYELPMQRNWSKNKSKQRDSHGWCDYWCSYRGVDFFIEVKHSYVAYGVTVKNKIPQTTLKYWYEANKQLSVIRKDIRKQMMDDSKGGIFLTLHIVPIYNTAKSKDKVEYNSETLVDIQQLALDKFYPKPNWSFVWNLNPTLLDKSKEIINDGEKTVRYPAVLIVGRALHRRIK